MQVNIPKLVIQKRRTIPNYSKDEEKNKVEVAVYKIIKSMVNPYIKWSKYIMQEIFSSVVVVGEYGASVVMWIPDRGFFIHDLEVDTRIETITDVFGEVRHKVIEYYIKEENMEELTRIAYEILIRDNKEYDLIERYEGMFEVNVFNNVMRCCQRELFEKAISIYGDRISLCYQNNENLCYFCSKIMVDKKIGLVCGLCECENTYRYNDMNAIILIYHAVCPNLFEIEEYISKKGEQKTKYKYKLGHHKYIIKIRFNNMKVDNSKFGAFSRGQYSSVKEKREQIE